MKAKFMIEVKEHKVKFVLDLLKNMPFVTVTEIKDTPQEKAKENNKH